MENNDIFDQINQRIKTWQYQWSAKITSRLMLYNSHHPDKVLSIVDIAEAVKVSKDVVKQIFAGNWNIKHDYQIVENYLLKKGNDYEQISKRN